MKIAFRLCIAVILCALTTSARAATIDRLSTTAFDTYAPDGNGFGHGLLVLGSIANYYLSDGTQWQSGAGSYSIYRARLTISKLSDR